MFERCYWPLLALAATHGPIGIEATGYTLEAIANREPEWVENLATILIQAEGRPGGSARAMRSSSDLWFRPSSSPPI